MESLWQLIVIKHKQQIEKIEKKYVDYIQQLLLQKSKILVAIQANFYEELKRLNITVMNQYHPKMANSPNLMDSSYDNENK